MIAAGLAAFTPSWASSHSKYDPAAEVDLKRAKEIFPLDFVQCFLKILAEKTTPKVARLTIKELAKKNGGREGLHDLFLERPLDLSKQITARQIKQAQNIVEQLRRDCATFVVKQEHRRRVMFGAAVRIANYARGYLARKLAEKRRRRREKRIRDDRAASKIQALVRRVQARWRAEERCARQFLWQRRGRRTRHLERATVVGSFHVRNDPDERRLSLLLKLDTPGQKSWDPYLLGASCTWETVPSLVWPCHPNGAIVKGETAVLFAHYGPLPSDPVRGRRAPVVICRCDALPPTRKQRAAEMLTVARAMIYNKRRTKQGSAGSRPSPPANSKKKRPKKRSKKALAKMKAKADAKAAKLALGAAGDVVQCPTVPFDDSTSPANYLLLLNGEAGALPAVSWGYGGPRSLLGTEPPHNQGCVLGSRQARCDREDFYVLQHMSSFMGRDLVRYLAGRRELPALASPDGTGADGKWATDRRRKYWESTSGAHHFAIKAHRRRLVGVKTGIPRASAARAENDNGGQEAGLELMPEATRKATERYRAAAKRGMQERARSVRVSPLWLPTAPPASDRENLTAAERDAAREHAKLRLRCRSAAVMPVVAVSIGGGGGGAAAVVDEPSAGKPWRLIFFDDDGVLNTEDTPRFGRRAPRDGESAYTISTSPWTLDPEKCARLVSVCNETGAKLVCCSPRRAFVDLRDQLTSMLFNKGLPQDGFLGFTPDLSPEDSPGVYGPSLRRAEIAAWLADQHPSREIEAWVIIDTLNMLRGDGRGALLAKDKAGLFTALALAQRKGISKRVREKQRVRHDVRAARRKAQMKEQGWTVEDEQQGKKTKKRRKKKKTTKNGVLGEDDLSTVPAWTPMTGANTAAKNNDEASEPTALTAMAAASVAAVAATAADAARAGREARLAWTVVQTLIDVDAEKLPVRRRDDDDDPGAGGGIGGNGIGGGPLDMRDHFVRVHIRKGLNEERVGEVRRLILLPNTSRLEILERKLVARKANFEERSSAFLQGYPTDGPFVPGLKASESTRRLTLFLKVFKELDEDMHVLDQGYTELRSIIDKEPFLSSPFKWDSKLYRKVTKTFKELQAAQDKVDDEKRAVEQRQREIQCLKQGGRFCPKCGELVHPAADFRTSTESNAWLQCTSTTCGLAFCQRCGAPRSAIEAHGLHRHVVGCPKHKKRPHGAPADKVLRFWSASTPEVKKGLKKAGDVRCQQCAAMQLETASCIPVAGLPQSWHEDKDPDPKLKRIRRALAER